MTSRLELRHAYPEPPERMAEVLVDPDYLQAKLREVGGSGAELVSRTERNGKVTVVLRQSVPTDSLPSFVRSLAPVDLRIERTEIWDGTRGRTHAVIGGAPGTISGTMSLDPDGAGSALGARIEADVPVPLVGGKVEKVITDNIGKLMQVEYTFTLDWLRGRPA
ncbi:MAG: DUF2505 domain-containing protein [Pseudonocardiaceae bacterium]